MGATCVVSKNRLNLVQIFAFAISSGRFFLYLKLARIFRLIRIVHQNRQDQYRDKTVWPVAQNA